MPQPIVLTCGEPAGVGPELAPKALAAGVPFVFLGDPRHLPAGTAWQEVAAPGEPVPEGVLAVLRHDFPAPAVPGRPDPANAQAVIEVIARAVGPMGPNAEYLLNTVASLEALGLEDAELAELAALVRGAGSA